jgi:hypothetical protein
MSKDQERQVRGIERRGFLRGAGIAAAGAVAVVPAAAGAAEAHESPQEQVKARYRETDHVKRFYDLNRL